MKCITRLFSGIVVVVVSMAVLIGCAGSPPLDTSGLYGPNPGRQAVSGSQGQGVAARSITQPPAQILQAARSALAELGYTAGDSDNPLVASGRYLCDGSHRVTMAVYVVPEAAGSRVTVLFDNHDRPCSLGDVAEVGATQVFKAIERELKT